MKKFIAAASIAIVAVGGPLAASASAGGPTKGPWGIQTAPSKYGSVKSGMTPSTLAWGATGAYSVNHIVWKSWEANKAVGYGLQRTNLCEPTCADSTKYHYLVVTVTATQPKSNKFTRLSVEATDPRDPGVYTTK